MAEERSLPSRREAIVGGGAAVAGAVALSSLLQGCAKRPAGLPAATPWEDETARTDPALVKYREERKIPVAMTALRGVCVSAEGRIWVSGDQRAAMLRSDGSIEREVAVGGPAGAIACGRTGGLYIAVDDHIEYVSPGSEHGSAKAWPSLGARSVITSIAVAPKWVFVADAGARRVVALKSDGSVHAVLCEKDPSRGYEGLIVPSPHLDIAVDGDDVLHVVNPGSHRIELYELDGSPKWSWGEGSQDMPGFCGCCNPTDFALLPDGRYVTSEKGIPRVKVYGKDGHFAGVVAGPEAFAAGVVGLDLATTQDGHVLVLDPVAKAIRVFVPLVGSPHV